MGNYGKYRGPAPKPPKSVIDAIEEFFKYSNQWLRRYEETWFTAIGSIPAFDASRLTNFRLTELPGLLEDAKTTLKKLSDAALAAQEDIDELKKAVERKLKLRAEKPAKKQPKAPSRRKR